MEYLKPYTETVLLTTQLTDDIVISFIGCYLYCMDHPIYYSEEYIWNLFEDEDYRLLEPYYTTDNEKVEIPDEVYETIQNMASTCVEQFCRIYDELKPYLGFILQPLLSEIDGEYNYIHPMDIHVNESWNNVLVVMEIN